MARLSGLNPSAVICEIMKEDGSMARLNDLVLFAKKFNLKLGSIEDLIRYRLENETLISQVIDKAFPHPLSKDFRIKVFKNLLDDSENIVIQKGEIKKSSPTLVRVKVENPMKDVFGGGFYKPHFQIESTLKTMAKSPSAVFVYLRKEGKYSLISQQATSLNDSNKSPKMDSRDYGIGAQILRELGVGLIHLIARKKPKSIGLKGFGLDIVQVSSEEEEEETERLD